MNAKFSAGLASSSKVDSGAYTDLNRLSQFKAGRDRDSEANIRKVAQEFESLFLNEMMKSMRQAGEAFAEGNYLNSNETKTYQDMHDQQLAVTLSKQGGVGLADVLTRQLSKTNKSTGPNPFAQVQSGVQANWPVQGSKQVAKAEASGFAERDDSKLLNQRRLALPGKLSDRQAAGIVPSPEQVAGTSLAGKDWTPAKTYAAPERESVGIEATKGTSKRVFASRNEFIETLLPMAEKAAERIGVDPRYLVAQAALETGWGKSIIREGDGTSSHNLFGIKAHKGWDGDSARTLTTEYKGGKAVKEAASFRSYNSFEQSFHDYVSFLQNNDRYDKALNSADNSEQFVRELQKAGYATDPQYARKISQIARGMQVYQAVAAVDSTTTRI
ncbi:flagellar assembly peptidoglycan hydrolase FlgJ [Pseudomonas sp. JM0905a]|uniref:flagellar assembly peptidoglycan hydrolase FlgJ n=1 Tax=Pseudomonas sp. JM0905a TaxID=2772484 RepID=UPI001683CB11|nr:flagellar assembly peptidoglycan hydrolase FlgJ [Pseudomonas sp. JM0905a]MBD2837646.1 flagellar assembly peptidoglycan hydrolase FlgJ [Pseudomonas sp. JM0905a]